MNVLHNFTCIYHDFDATVVKQKLGDNIVTVTNNVLHSFLKIYAVVKVLPCFPIIADTGTFINLLCPSHVERNNDVPLFAVDARNM